jgi:hypothetical protein
MMLNVSHMELKYLIKPYHVGSKNAKSLAIIIPSQLRREASIDSSAIFLLRINEETKIMTLQNIKQWIEKYQDATPADRSKPNQQNPRS